MNIGFDIHGVIDANPELFSCIIKELKKLNYKIHLLTGSRITDNLIHELEDYDIVYDEIFSILDYHLRIETDMWKDDRGNFWIDEDIWNESKGSYCNNNNFLFHIDDTKIYGDFFNTPFGYISYPTSDNVRILEIKGDVDDNILKIFKSHEGYFKLKFI